MKNTKPFCIIIGRGRSGTTLISKILNRNSAVSIPGEFLFPINLFSKYSTKVINKQVIQDFVDDVFFEKRFKQKNFNKIELKQYLFEIKPENYRDLCLYTYENLSSQLGKDNIKLFGDKNPHYAMFIPRILKIFNNIKFIYIVRDYRDNILSYKNVKFDMNNLYALAYRWSFFNKKILDFKKLYPDLFLLIKYEDLLLKPEKEIKQVCKFLDLDFDLDMLEFYKEKSDNLSSWHRNLNLKLNPNNINKWENTLNQNQLGKIDFICNPTAYRLDYKEKSKFNTILYFKTIIFVFYAKLYTFFELLLFHLPFSFRTRIINLIRDFQRTNTP